MQSQIPRPARLAAALQTVIDEARAPAPNFARIRRTVRDVGVRAGIHERALAFSLRGDRTKMTEYLLGQWAQMIDAEPRLLRGESTPAVPGVIISTAALVGQDSTLLPPYSLVSSDIQYARRLSAALQTVVNDMATRPHDYGTIRQAIRDAGVPPAVHAGEPQEGVTGNPKLMTEYLLGQWAQLIDGDPRLMRGPSHKELPAIGEFTSSCVQERRTVPVEPASVVMRAHHTSHNGPGD